MKRLLCALCCSVLVVGLSGCDSDEMKSAKADFDKQVERIHSQEDELNESVTKAKEFLDNCGTPLFEEDKDNLKVSIQNAEDSIVVVPSRPKELEDIVKVTESELVKIDYSDVIVDVKGCQKDLEKSVKMFELLSNPSPEFVVERLKSVENITGVEATTEENDPNGNMNKPGGYTVQAYFSYSLIDQNSVFGNSIIEKGTDCGGSVEVYTSVEDANRRNEYLANFDGTILSGGSHRVVGTLVVRTSEELTASEQKELESNIIEVLARLD